MPKYDAAGKKIIRLYNQAWSEWVSQAQQIEVEELSGEFQVITRHNDSLLKVLGVDGEFLSLTELQFLYDETMDKRLAIYKLLAEQKYGLNAFVTVVFFLPPPKGKTIPTSYHREFMGQEVHVDFRIIKIWELDADAILRYDNPMLLPFVPLMKGGDTEQVLHRCAQRIRQEPVVEAAELETALAIFAGYVLDVEMIRAILGWEMSIVQESPILQELKNSWLEEGREEGRGEGKEATLSVWRSFLAFRFGIPETHFDGLFAMLDLSDLAQLKPMLFDTQSLPELEEQLRQFAQARQQALENGNGEEHEQRN